MIKPIIVSGIFLLAGVSGQVMANCNTNNGWKVVVAADLTGKTACVGAAPTWDSQEEHVAGGVLNDWKQSQVPGNTTDPKVQVGQWALSGGVVTYNYGAGGTYSYNVFTKGNRIDFCGINGAPTITNILLKNGAC
jgi:hypothetical protein